LLAVFVVVIDRTAWASVAEWREDQATNIWLAYTRSPLQVPVGLVSSISLPNPNGLVLVSEFLSHLPSLWSVSTFLGVLQAGLLVWVCWLVADETRLFLLVVGPVLASIVLRSASVELVLQWTLILVNLLCFGGILVYLRRPTPWVLPLFTAVILLAPSIYLAGALNAVLYALVVLVVLVAKPASLPRHGWLAPIMASLGIALLSIWLTWLPFFQEVGLAGVRRASEYAGLTGMERLGAAAEAIIRFPIWSLAQYGEYGTIHGLPPLQVDQRVQSLRIFTAYQWSLRIILLQGFVCYSSIIIAAITVAIRRRPPRDLIAPDRGVIGLALALMLLFVMMAYAIAPLLGGAVWARDRRLDEAVQFIPFLLIVWFATPQVLELPDSVHRLALTVTCATSILFTALSLPIGFAIVRNNLKYNGELLIADVPLVDKVDAVRFIAEDWKSRSSSLQVPVDYDLGGGKWDWIPEFGTKYEKWYPAPYTIGRAYDYMFLRAYGLSNSQEGAQLRSFGGGRYLITYAFEPSPVMNGDSTRDYLFGRLRVTIVLGK
jgi:hypothetical protein